MVRDRPFRRRVLFGRRCGRVFCDKLACRINEDRYLAGLGNYFLDSASFTIEEILADQIVVRISDRPLFVVRIKDKTSPAAARIGRQIAVLVEYIALIFVEPVGCLVDRRMRRAVERYLVCTKKLLVSLAVT